MKRPAHRSQTSITCVLLAAGVVLASCARSTPDDADRPRSADATEGTVRAAVQRNVVVNDRPVDPALLAELQDHYRLWIDDGRYWYDRTSGAAGPAGGPTLTFIVPDLDLGGPLAADASAGNTGVFLNGRELPQYDLIELTRLVGFVRPGRYFLDASGNAGFEGGPPMINLVAASRQHPLPDGGWYAAGDGTAAGAGHYAYVIGRDASGRSWGARN